MFTDGVAVYLQMATDFSVELEEKLAKVLSIYNDDLVLKDKQKIALSEFYKGRDVVASLPTGFGKSVGKGFGERLRC